MTICPSLQMTRIASAEFPDTPIPLAVAPENLRFYEALVGATLVAEARPLYGAPAILMRTSGGSIVEYTAQRRSPIQRTMDVLVGDPDPDWVDDRREGAPLPADWLAPLLAECAGYGRLRDQEALLATLADDDVAPWAVTDACAA